ncbi:MAG: FAD-dependent oxidoreductase, partial [Bacteroidota bacterium]
MKRSDQLEQLRTEEFDCLVIGGGASGAGSALDSVLRGYKTALVEKTDFAAETSSKSTKLIHGGVRYLEQAFKNFDFAQLTQVRHGLEERHTVLKNAPHLARPLALITPVFSWIEGLYFTIGLTIYGWFASGKDTLPGSRWLSKREVKERLPRISNRIHSAVLYYDGQLDDARYCLAIAQTAAAKGATVANHVEITGFEHNEEGRLVAALAKDLRTGEELKIRAKVFINCTGPFADHIRL